MKVVTGTVLATVLAAAAATARADIVVRYDFTGNTGAEGLLLPDELHPNVLSSNLNRGSGVASAALSDSYAATGWAGPEATDFFTVSIQPQLGYQFELASIDFGAVRTGTDGATSLELTWSGDNHSTVLGSFGLTDVPTTYTFASPMTITDQVAFRLRAIGMPNDTDLVALTNQNGTAGLVMNGVLAPTAVPEPGSIVLLSLTGLAAVGVRQWKRRRHSPSSEKS